MNNIYRALTIAGSDSGGGAGVQADLKTFTALKTYGLSVITSLTAQNTLGVSSIHNLPVDFIEAELDSVATDIGCDAAKIGMISNVEIIDLVSRKIEEYEIKKLVLDPVMMAKGGTKLLEKNAISVLIDRLIPLSLIVTPNIPEAETLSAMKIKNIEDMKKAAERIIKNGCKNVLIKGGHLQDDPLATDILFDGDEMREFSSERIQTKNTHGTGCTYSAAICAGLAKGFSLKESIGGAKEYVSQAIKNSIEIGSGCGPLNHFWNS